MNWDGEIIDFLTLIISVGKGRGFWS